MNKNMKNGRFILIALMGLSLAACGGNTPSSTTNEQGTTSNEGTSQQATTSEQESLGPTYLEVSIKNTTIPEGGNFFDFCKPTVLLHDEGKETMDVTEFSNRTEYTITKVGDEETTYKAGDSLPVGSYSCRVRYLQGKRPKTTVNFKVESATIVTGSEGHGYKTYTLDSISDYTYSKYSKVDTLSGGAMPSLNNSKVLVIPVQFTNVTFDDPNTDVDEGEIARQVMHEAFFADTEDTPWESLASYYKKSSYGKLNITGKVTPIYTYNASDENITDQGIARTICNAAVEYFKKTGEIVGTDYDSDGDGYIDGVELIYMTTHGTPSSTQDSGSQNDIWWNYTTNASGSRNVSSPGAHRMFWSRWDYLTQKYYAKSEKGILVDDKKVDPHTIIHETGHMMGAPDYYSYAHDEGPAGCVDMMDCNVGDHNAYTKMQYGWVAPKVVDGSENNFTMTLKSFTETGEFILLRDTSEKLWNETPFDEYLVLQYYTPTGLNEMDHLGYGEWIDAVSSTGDSAYGHAGTYAHAGLQVFHADGRVVSDMGTYKDGVKGPATPNWTDDPRPDNYVDATNGVYGSAATRTLSNTGNLPGRSSMAPIDGSIDDTDMREFSIILPSGVNSFTGNSYTNNMGVMANLFGLNDVELDGGWKGDATASKADSKFGGSHYSAYKMNKFYPNSYFFNDGSKLNWSFEVVEQTADEVTIHFINTNI